MLLCCASFSHDSVVAPAVWHIRVLGDIRSAEAADAVLAALREADDQGARAALIELDANTLRTDLAAGLARRMRELNVHVGVLLRDPRDREVGLGALLLGSAARWCWIDPGTSVRGTYDPNQTPPQRSPERALAPEDTDWQRVERELSGLVWVRVRERGGDPSLGASLVFPAAPVRAIDLGSGAWRAPDGAPVEPGQRAVHLIHADALGKLTIDIPAAALEGLALIDGQHDSLSDAQKDLAQRIELQHTGSAPDAAQPSRQRSQPAQRVRRDVQDPLDQHARSADDALRMVEERAVTAQAKVRAAWRKRVGERVPSGVVERTREDVGRDLAHATSLIGELESLIARTPELVQLPAPRQPMGESSDASDRRTAWRRAIDDARKRVASAQHDLDKLIAGSGTTTLDGP